MVKPVVKKSPLGKIPERLAERRAWFRNAFIEWKKQMKSGLSAQQAGENLQIPNDVVERWIREDSVGVPGSGRRRNGWKEPEREPEMTSDELWKRYFAAPLGSEEAIELRAKIMKCGPSISVEDESSE